MGADKLAENTPNAPKLICPNCLPKIKKLRISVKKGFIGCPWSMHDVNTEYIIPVNCVILLSK